MHCAEWKVACECDFIKTLWALCWVMQSVQTGQAHLSWSNVQPYTLSATARSLLSNTLNIYQTDLCSWKLCKRKCSICIQFFLPHILLQFEQHLTHLSVLCWLVGDHYRPITDWIWDSVQSLFNVTGLTTVLQYYNVYFITFISRLEIYGNMVKPAFRII